MRVIRLTLILSAAALLGLSSCKSSRHTVRGSSGKIEAVAASDPRAAGAVVECARTWIGTPYRYGGNDRDGVDCSGLTCNVFREAVGLSLPRTSAQQCEYGRRVDRRQLSAGDLIFFENKSGSGRINHVGLYIGDGQMIHASSSKGVMVSSIDQGYWAERYYASGRVIGPVQAVEPEIERVVPAPQVPVSAPRDALQIPLSVFEALSDSISADWLD